LLDYVSFDDTVTHILCDIGLTERYVVYDPSSVNIHFRRSYNQLHSDGSSYNEEDIMDLHAPGQVQLLDVAVWAVEELLLSVN
jgi:hypothetical protein